ncbi:MAG: hypothetical protein M3040_04070 [Bacteroidota bacterium]|nr:hypothetical protein [Bacteroidota bacterium]
MKNVILLASAATLLLLFSCEQHKTDIKKYAEKLAVLECRAIGLREKRFELANRIRFTQDTLRQKAVNSDTFLLTSKLKSYNNEKEIILQQSLSLADSIQSTLKDIMKNQLNNQPDKLAFNELLNQILQQKGCIKKQP